MLILFISTGVAVILLAILIYAIPLRLSMKERGVILAASVFVGLIGMVTLQMSVLWQVILFPFLLSIIFSYFILKKLDLNAEPEAARSMIEEITPVFSFDKQIEKAKLAETIDEYYDDVKMPIHEEPITDMSGTEMPSTLSPQTMIPDVEIQNSEKESIEMPDIETSNMETQSVELAVSTSIEVEAKQQLEDSSEILEPILSSRDGSSEVMESEIDVIDFKERELHSVDEPSHHYVEQSIASTIETDDIETEEEQLMANRRKLFQSMDHGSDKLADQTEFSPVSESIDDRTTEEIPEEINNTMRLEKLENISDFTSLDETQDVPITEEFESNSPLATIDDDEEINAKPKIGILEDVGSIEELEQTNEISEEDVAESEQKQATESRKKQKMYEEKVLAQFEDLEEMYLRKKEQTKTGEE